MNVAQPARIGAQAWSFRAETPPGNTKSFVSLASGAVIMREAESPTTSGRDASAPPQRESVSRWVETKSKPQVAAITAVSEGSGGSDDAMGEKE